MKLASNAYFRAAMEFVHDMAAGAFPGAVLVAWLITRSFSGASVVTMRMLRLSMTNLWLVLLVSLILLAITGGFRLRYWQLNVREGYLKRKQQMVIVKHVAFSLTLVASIIVMFALLPR